MRIVIASHGTMAAGIKNSAEIILGKNNHIDTICAYVDESVDYQEVIKETIVKHNYEDTDLIVLTDLLGGSINNEFLKYINDYDFLLVSGMNLALLIEIAVRNKVDEADIRELLDNCQSNMQLFSKLSLDSIEDDDFN